MALAAFVALALLALAERGCCDAECGDGLPAILSVALGARMEIWTFAVDTVCAFAAPGLLWRLRFGVG